MEVTPAASYSRKWKLQQYTVFVHGTRNVVCLAFVENSCTLQVYLEIEAVVDLPLAGRSHRSTRLSSADRSGLSALRFPTKEAGSTWHLIGLAPLYWQSLGRLSPCPAMHAIACNYTVHNIGPIQFPPPHCWRNKVPRASAACSRKAHSGITWQPPPTRIATPRPG